MKKSILKKALLTAATGVLMMTLPLQAEAAPQLVINNVLYVGNASSGQAELIKGRVYVPLRTISEGLGYAAQWDATSRTVHISTNGNAAPTTKDGGDRIRVRIDGQLLVTDDSTGRPYIKNGRTMVPLRLIGEGLGAGVEWQHTTQTVTVQGKEQVKPAADTTVVSVPFAEESLPLAGDTATATSEHDKDASSLSIRGDSVASLESINAYLANREALVQRNAAANGKTFVPFPKDIGRLYYEIGKKYNIRGDVALAQALHETGNFQYGNEVQPIQNNYCGLGAIGRVTTEADLNAQVFAKIDRNDAFLVVGQNGWYYRTPALGVEAHIQHLYSYAYSGALPAGTQLVDGRFNHGNRGAAIYWADLNGKWAVPGNGYGEILIERYWRDMIKA